MMIKLLKSKIYLIAFVLIALLSISVISIKTLTGSSWLDAIYITVITISTVGYKEVVPYSNETKIFVISLILVSVILTAFSLSLITQYVLERYSLHDFKQKKLKKEIKKLTNHVIVCGYGRNGMQAVKKLKQYNKTVVVIEKDETKWEDLDHESILYIKGDAIEDQVLQEANITNASFLISALHNDADNLFIVLSAKQLNKQLKVICRASTETNYKKMKLAGADNVILPEKIGGDHLASLIVTPDLLDFFDRLSISDGDTRNVRDIKFDVLCADKNETTIKDLTKFHKTGCKIIGYKGKDNQFEVNPDDDFKLEKESSVIVIGNHKQIQALDSVFNLKS